MLTATLHDMLATVALADLARAPDFSRCFTMPGVVRGFVDLLFEHEGRVFVCDWKSDDLPSFDPEALARHCDRNYDVQARIYAVAAPRMAGITDPADYARRFGGMVFVFLRGLGSQKDGGDGDGDGTDGIHFFKPSWEEILAWETDMLGQRFWGIAR